MARLEDLTRGALVKGIPADGPVEVLDAKWHGTNVVKRCLVVRAGSLAEQSPKARPRSWSLLANGPGSKLSGSPAAAAGLR